jgi:protein transport protein SEC24
MSIPKLDNELNQKIRNLISGLRNCHSRFMPLHIIKEDSKRRGEFLQLLVDDRTDSSMSYYEFLNFVCAEIAKIA